MNIDKQAMNHNLATIGWALLFIWWGISIIVGPISIGMSAVGTGLILLGVNALRWLQGIPTNGSTTAWGIIAITWGALDHTLRLSIETSFATLLILIGVIAIAFLPARSRTA